MEQTRSLYPRGCPVQKSSAGVTRELTKRWGFWRSGRFQPPRSALMLIQARQAETWCRQAQRLANDSLSTRPPETRDVHLVLVEAIRTRHEGFQSQEIGRTKCRPGSGKHSRYIQDLVFFEG